MRYLFVLLLLNLQSIAQTGTEILQKSDEKIRTLKAISYNIYSETKYEKVTADVVIKRGNDLPVFETGMIRLSGLSIDNDGSKQITFACNGSGFDFIDPDTHELVRLENPSYSKISRTRLMGYTLLAMACYWQKEPFIALKDMKSADRMEDTVIYKTPCYKIKIRREVNSEIMGKLTFESYWFIGKDDLLFYGVRSATGIQLLHVKAVNQEVDKSFFELASTQEVKKMTGLEPIGTGLLSTGSEAPSWTLPSAGPEKISLSSLKGKVVLLDFWGTWCVPCIRTMPEIQAIYDHFKGKDVAVIGVSVETESKADPVGFMKRKGYTYPIVLDGRTITTPYKVAEFPTVYLIDKNGKIIHSEHGGNRENFKEDIISKIEHALSGK